MITKSFIRRLDHYKNIIPNLEQRLKALSIYQKHKNVGNGHSSTPHENAINFSKAYNIKLAVGYIVTPDLVSGSLRLYVHSWCLDNKKVVEPTSNITWNSNVFYLGVEVPENLIENQRYLNLFLQPNIGFDYV